MTASTASRASRLLWMSERSPIVGPEAASGVDAFVSVEEQNTQRGGHRNGHEKPEDAAQVAAHDEGHDDQHGAEMDRVAEHLGRDEVVDDVRDHEVEDQHDDDF